MNAITELEKPSREIAFTRVYSAPKNLVIRMWSNPDHVSNWWGPRGFTTTTHAMEFKADGIWRFTMHSPEGADYRHVIRYTYVSPDRIEYEQLVGFGTIFTARIDFVDAQPGTEMRFCMTFQSPEIREEIIEQCGAEEGLKQTMIRLGEYCEGQDPKAIELVIVRQFDAEQERVWKALTEPEQLQKWKAPVGFELELGGAEFRVGGRWTSVMSNESAGMHAGAEGEYLAIEPNHLLQYTHRWMKDDGTFKPTTTITYKLHTYEGKTTLTFTQSGFWSEEAAAAHLYGWDSCQHRLAVLLGATKADQIVLLVREFDAPIDLVWKCWTEPDRVASWFAPLPYTCPKCEIDLVPGGKFFLVMRSPQGDDHAMSSIICDIEPQSRLGWVASVPEESGDVAIRGGTMVLFDDLGGRTRVTVHMYAGAYTEQGIGMVGGMEQGWTMTLDQMIEVATSLAKTGVAQ